MRLYALGAFVNEIEEKLDFPAVEACLGGDELLLDLSQDAVVRDGCLEAGLRVLAAEAGKYY